MTASTVCLSNFGSRQSTVFSRSSPGMRRASGLRTMRPNICAMYVWSFAGRKETITSARGQSQPVLIASLAMRTRTHVSFCTRCGSMYGTV